MRGDCSVFRGTKMRDLRQFWGIRRLAEDRIALVRLGSLRFWLARAEREWALASEVSETSDVADIAQVPSDVVPESLTWVRTLFKKAPRDFRMIAVVPDRPIVVAPSDEMQLPAGERVDLYCKLPIGLEVQVQEGKEWVPVGRIEHERLSDTWFGTPTAGELCYSIREPFALSPEDVSSRADGVLFRVQIENRHKAVLRLGAVCLRPALTRLHCGGEGLQAGRVRLQLDGTGKQVDDYSGKPTESEANLLQVITATQERAKWSSPLIKLSRRVKD